MHSLRGESAVSIAKNRPSGAYCDRGRFGGVGDRVGRRLGRASCTLSLTDRGRGRTRPLLNRTPCPRNPGRGATLRHDWGMQVGSSRAARAGLEQRLQPMTGVLGRVARPVSVADHPASADTEQGAGCPTSPGSVRHSARTDTQHEVGRTLLHPPTFSGWIKSEGQDLDLLTEPRSSRSTMERSVSERPTYSIPARTIPSGPAFAFRTSPLSVMSMEAPTGRRTETRRPTRSEESGWRRSIPTPRIEKSKTPQSRHRWEGSPST